MLGNIVGKCHCLLSGLFLQSIVGSGRGLCRLGCFGGGFCWGNQLLNNLKLVEASEELKFDAADLENLSVIFFVHRFLLLFEFSGVLCSEVICLKLVEEFVTLLL